MSWQHLIREVPDFPKPGIFFKDIMPVLANPQGFESLIKELSEALKDFDFEAIVGIESRGFILGSALARVMNKGFVPARKKGKLPPPIVAESYQLEYGVDVLEMNPGSGKVIVIDDVLATGGTATATLRLCERAGYSVQQLAVVIDLKFLNEFRFKGQPAISLISVS